MTRCVAAISPGQSTALAPSARRVASDFDVPNIVVLQMQIDAHMRALTRGADLAGAGDTDEVLARNVECPMLKVDSGYELD